MYSASAISLSVALVGLAFSASPVSAQLGSPFGATVEEEKPHATMRLAVASERLTPGEGEIAVIFELDAQWHLYWKNPGDTGLPPAVEFDLPEGVELAGELEWPAPRRYIHGGGQLLDYIYDDAFALIQPVRIDDSLLGRTVEISASGSWLVCKEACLPGDGSATMSVRVEESAGRVSDDAALIFASMERVPVGADEVGVSARWEGLELVVEAEEADRMEWFALAPGLGGPVDPIAQGVAYGGELRVLYGERARRAARVTAVVGVSRDGRTEYARLTIDPPSGSAARTAAPTRE